MDQQKRSNLLGPVDLAFLYVDTDKSPMNIGAVTMFDGKIEYDALVKLVDERIHLAPIYQKRLMNPIFNLGQPGWAFDPDFYAANHIFHVKLETNTDNALHKLIGQLVSSKLDRDKPLWEIYLIDGYKDGQSVIFFKVHHCLVDGLAAVELLTVLFDLSPEPWGANKKKPIYDPPYLPKAHKVLIESMRREIPYKWSIVKKLWGDLSFFKNVLTDKESRKKALIGIAYLINNNLSPLKKLPINGKNSGKQVLGWAEFSLAEVRAIKAARNASVNDVMLTILAGAIERYTRKHGNTYKQDFVRILIPVSMRTKDENSSFGNRISVLPIDTPFNLDDPLDLLDAVTENTRVMKESSLSNGLDMLLTVPSLAPAASQPLIWSVAPAAFSLLAHTWCTNVAGPQIPLYLLGKKMRHSYGFFPLNPSMGMACVVMSYNQRISMTLVMDTEIIQDVQSLKNELENSFTALRKAAKVQPIEPIVIERISTETSTKTQDKIEETEAKTDESGALDEDDTSTIKELVTITSDNGNQALARANTPTTTKAEEIVSPQAEPVEESEVSSGEIKIFSDAWAREMQTSINNSQAYYKASTKWKAGSLAFVMTPSPQDGYPYAVSTIMDLHQGRCRSAKSSTMNEAMRDANFVIVGTYESWMKVLNGQAAPLSMILKRKLSLKKGSLTKLLPFTQSAQELVNCAKSI